LDTIESWYKGLASQLSIEKEIYFELTLYIRWNEGKSTPRKDAMAYKMDDLMMDAPLSKEMRGSQRKHSNWACVNMGKRVSDLPFSNE